MHYLAAILMAVSIPMVVKVMAALGIGFVTYTGADLVLTEGQTWLNGQVNSLPADMLQILFLMGLDQGLAIVFSAFAAHITILTTVGAFTRFGKMA